MCTFFLECMEIDASDFSTVARGRGRGNGRRVSWRLLGLEKPRDKSIIQNVMICEVCTSHASCFFQASCEEKENRSRSQLCESCKNKKLWTPILETCTLNPSDKIQGIDGKWVVRYSWICGLTGVTSLISSHRILLLCKNSQVSCSVKTHTLPVVPSEFQRGLTANTRLDLRLHDRSRYIIIRIVKDSGFGKNRKQRGYAWGLKHGSHVQCLRKTKNLGMPWSSLRSPAFLNIRNWPETIFSYLLKVFANDLSKDEIWNALFLGDFPLIFCFFISRIFLSS